METIKFNPNIENIKKRENLKPFGNIAFYTKFIPKNIQFKIYSNTLESEVQSEVKIQKKKINNIYIPPSFDNAKYQLVYNEISIRITNIPKSLEREVLTDILKKSYGKEMDYVHLLQDKETKKNKGIAYINIGTLEAAREFYKKTNNIIIDNYKLTIEILQK